MAGQRITFSIDITLVGGSPNEVVQIKAPANIRGRLAELYVMGMQPAGGTDAPTAGRLTRSTGSFGTFVGTVVKEKENTDNGETIQSVFSGGADGSGGSTRPTTPSATGVIFSAQPQGGTNITPLLPDDGFDVPGGEAVNVELMNAAAVRHLITGTWVE